MFATAILTCTTISVAANAPLADAAEKSDWPHVRALLKQHADVNAAQADGMTALHWAAQLDNLETAKLLLASGADAQATNRYGVTPLSLACVNGIEGVVAALLDAGADANTTLRGGETALMTAARTGRVVPVKLLLSRGGKVDAHDRKGQTALMWAAADGHAAVVELLIKAGADANARLSSGFTPLLFAVREGRMEVVQSLLRAGGDPNEMLASDKAGGKTAERGLSALTLAVENGHFELALALIKAGANPNDTRAGYAPLHVVTWVRKPNRGDDATGHPPPIGSGNIGSLEFVKRLVADGAEVNVRWPQGAPGRGPIAVTGATPFLLAAKNADLALMRLLLELGADHLLPNKDNSTPLMAAAGLGTRAPDEEAGTEAEALEAAALLLKLGADINAVDNKGETAMHGAAYKSLPKMVEMLAERGAKIEIWHQKNKSGWTPLMIAEGFRPGNFKPSAETIVALHKVMRAAGVTPPPPTPRPGTEPKGYESPKAGN